jgi:hypothetical protein
VGKILSNLNVSPEERKILNEEDGGKNVFGEYWP